MKRSRISGLIVLNVALLVALAFVTLTPRVDAQESNRRPGDYIVVGGEMQNQVANAVYVLDTANLEIIALVFDRNRPGVQAAVWHDVQSDLKQGASR